jgi:hypothetical protein
MATKLHIKRVFHAIRERRCALRAFFSCKLRIFVADNIKSRRHDEIGKTKDGVAGHDPDAEQFDGFGSL